MKRGLVLFAHGARDARWSEPLEAVRERCQQACPGVPVALGFLEFLSPDLEGAVRGLVEDQCDEIVIVPMFLGQGGHLRRDFPPLVAALQHTFPDQVLRVAPSVGEDPGVLDALASYSIGQLTAAR